MHSSFLRFEVHYKCTSDTIKRISFSQVYLMHYTNNP